MCLNLFDLVSWNVFDTQKSPLPLPHTYNISTNRSLSKIWGNTDSSLWVAAYVSLLRRCHYARDYFEDFITFSNLFFNKMCNIYWGTDNSFVISRSFFIFSFEELQNGNSFQKGFFSLQSYVPLFLTVNMLFLSLWQRK